MYFEFHLFCIQMLIYDPWFPRWAQQMLGRECSRSSHFSDGGMTPNPHSQYFAFLHLCLWKVQQECLVYSPKAQTLNCYEQNIYHYFLKLSILLCLPLWLKGKESISQIPQITQRLLTKSSLSRFPCV